MVLLCLFCTPVIVLCQDQNLPPEWVFDDKDEIRTWEGLNQLQPLVVDTVKNKNGDKVTILRTVSTGVDPYVYPGGNGGGFGGDIEPFDGKKYSIIYIGVRANISNLWQIYYYTKEDPTWSENQRQNFQVNASDDFLDLEFKMTEGGWQTKTIKGFRLDPGTIAGVEAEIDYLSLRGVASGKPKAVEYKSKLAITWGEVKQ
jgi:hypothetical protein